MLDNDPGGLHFLPALRNASATGKLAVTWYDRASANTAVTTVKGALGIDPRLTSTPSANTLVTTVPTDWNSVSSDIDPNFGDYTDNYIANGRLYVAWSDGRLGASTAVRSKRGDAMTAYPSRASQPRGPDAPCSDCHVACRVATPQRCRVVPANPWP